MHVFLRKTAVNSILQHESSNNVQASITWSLKSRLLATPFQFSPLHFGHSFVSECSSTNEGNFVVRLCCVFRRRLCCFCVISLSTTIPHQLSLFLILTRLLQTRYLYKHEGIFISSSESSDSPLFAVYIYSSYNIYTIVTWILRQDKLMLICICLFDIVHF